MVVALLCAGIGRVAPVHAGPVLTTPAGLAPGAHFRFVFVTDGTTNGTSTNIATYDTFATNQAGGATYNGSTVTWQAIGSTATVNAIDHIGQTPDAVYLADGTKVTTSTTITGLWSGSLLHAINEDQSGAIISSEPVFTGTTSTGNADTTRTLGSTVVQGGFTTDTSAAWVAVGPPFGASSSLHIYSISQDLVVPGAVPEPSSWLTLGIGLGVTTVIGWSRHRREQRRRAAA
jgi:hypothetical protein